MVLSSVFAIAMHLMETEPKQCHFISDGKMLVNTECGDALRNHRLVMGPNKVTIDDCEFEFVKGSVSVTGCLVDQYTVRVEEGGVVVVTFRGPAK